jgi:hypothetical protein
MCFGQPLTAFLAQLLLKRTHQVLQRFYIVGYLDPSLSHWLRSVACFG